MWTKLAVELADLVLAYDASDPAKPSNLIFRWPAIVAKAREIKETLK